MSLKQSPGDLFRFRMQSPWFRWCRFWRQFWNNRWRYARHPIRSWRYHKFFNAVLSELLDRSEQEYCGSKPFPRGLYPKGATRAQILEINQRIDRMAEGKEIPYGPY